MNRPGSAISKAKVIKSSGSEGTQLKAVQTSLDSDPTENPNPPGIHQRTRLGGSYCLPRKRKEPQHQRREQSLAGLLQLPYGRIQVSSISFRKAIQIYEELIKKTDNKEYYAYKACCYYALCQYDDAKREALKGPEN